MKSFIEIILVILVLYCQNGNPIEHTLSEKVEELTKLTQNTPVIRLNKDKYKLYIKSKVRNYTSFVMFTALSPQRGCQICGVANVDYKLVAKSWSHPSQFSNNLFFFMVDFDDAQEVFQYLKMHNAPQFWLHPPKGGIEKFDFNKLGHDPAKIAKWLSDRIDKPIRIIRPLNYGAMIGTLVGIIAIGLLFYYTRLKQILFSRTIWAIISVCTVLIFISGQVWNRIRNPPFLYTHPQNGNKVYISGTNQYQFGAETVIVYALYAAITLGLIIMNSSKRVRGFKRIVVSLTGMIVFVGFFAYLLSIFKTKYQSYPFVNS